MTLAGATMQRDLPSTSYYPSDLSYDGRFTFVRLRLRSEDNDPDKRLMVVANYDNDVPEYWEWSGQGLFPFDTSNEAYKLGVNYILYGLTH